MSNVLIIKHGSLGDLIQANGAIKDIKQFYKNRKVFLVLMYVSPGISFSVIKQLAPLSKALFMKSWPLWFGPFKAKKISPSAIDLVSVETFLKKASFPIKSQLTIFERLLNLWSINN